MIRWILVVKTPSHQVNISLNDSFFPLHLYYKTTFVHLEIHSEKREEGHLQPLLCVLVAALGIICVILVSVIIIQNNRRKSASSEGPSHKKEAGKVTASVSSSQCSEIWTGRRNQELYNTDSAAGEEGRGAHQRQRPAQLDPRSHPPVWLLFSQQTLPTERWEHLTLICSPSPSGDFSDPEFWLMKSFKDPIQCQILTFME